MDNSSNNIIEARSISSARFEICLNRTYKTVDDAQTITVYDIDRFLRSKNGSDYAYFNIFGKYKKDRLIDSLLGNKTSQNDMALDDENFLDDFENENKVKDVQDLIDGKCLKVKCYFVIEIDSNFKRLIADTAHHSEVVENLLKRLESKGWHDINNNNMFYPFRLEARYIPDNDSIIKFVPSRSLSTDSHIVGTSTMVVRLNNFVRQELANLSPETAFENYIKFKGRSLKTRNLTLSGAYGLHTHRNKVTIYRNFEKNPNNFIIKLVEDEKKGKDNEEIKEMIKTELSGIQMLLPKVAWLFSYIENKKYLMASKPKDKNSFFFKGNRISQIEIPIIVNLNDIDPIIDDLTAFITAVTSIRDEAVHINNFFKTKNRRKELIEALTNAVKENPILFADKTKGSIGDITRKAAEKLLSNITEDEIIETDESDKDLT